MRELPIRKAAGIGLIYKNLICLSKRIYTFEDKPVEFGGYWSIFGGEIEEGESEAECAIRELYEESSVKVDPHQLISIKKIEHDVSSFSIFFARMHYLPDIRLNEEHTESGWFDIDVIEHFPFLIDSLILDCITDYRDNIMYN
jgi:8-oxo-dGTP pyrophosphatase MutT (NUDIX family)